MEAAGEPVSANVRAAAGRGRDRLVPRTAGASASTWTPAPTSPMPRTEGIARVASLPRVARRGAAEPRRLAGRSRRRRRLPGTALARRTPSARTSSAWSPTRCAPTATRCANFEAFVISGDADKFSVGANLMQLLLSAQEGEWDEVDLAVRAFQRMTAAIKFCPRPVVAAPFGFCLGGGARDGAARRAPAGPCRAVHGPGGDRRGAAARRRRLQGDDAARAGAAAAVREGGRSESVELMRGPAAQFRDHRHGQGLHLGHGGAAARLPRPGDRITMNRERLLIDAKELALSIADAGLRAAPAAHRYSRRRARTSWPRSSWACT